MHGAYRSFVPTSKTGKGRRSKARIRRRPKRRVQVRTCTCCMHTMHSSSWSPFSIVYAYVLCIPTALSSEQHARGGHSDNPNVVAFLHNAQAVHVQRTMAIGHGGNVRKRKEQWKTDIADLSRPLQKCPRKCLQLE